MTRSKSDLAARLRRKNHSTSDLFCRCTLPIVLLVGYLVDPQKRQSIQTKIIIIAAMSLTCFYHQFLCWLAPMHNSVHQLVDHSPYKPHLKQDDHTKIKKK